MKRLSAKAFYTWISSPTISVPLKAVSIGERVRKVLMGCSKKVRSDVNASGVFSGKQADGSPLGEGHQHAHYLCEAAAEDRRITHLTVFAPAGFDAEDELAFGRLKWTRSEG